MIRFILAIAAFWGCLIVPTFLLFMLIVYTNDYSWAIEFCIYIFLALFLMPWWSLSIYLRLLWFGGMLFVAGYFHLWFLFPLLLVAFVIVDLFLRRGLSRRGFPKEVLSIQAFSSLLLYVGQGGNTPLLNHHWNHPQQRYALDLVGIDASGRRAKGYFPARKEAYICFGATIYSPLSGVVVKAENEYPDLKVGEMDPQHPYGNHLVLQSSEHPEYQLVLAHLMHQSITVKVGDTIQCGDILGRIGNSGNTSEPHLHIQAQKVENESLKGIPLRIEGRFLMRNSLIRKRQRRLS